MKSGPRSPQLEKALAQKRRPNTAINKKLKKKKIWVNTINFSSPLEFSKLYLTVEAKINTLIWFQINAEKIPKTIISKTV